MRRQVGRRCIRRVSVEILPTALPLVGFKPEEMNKSPQRQARTWWTCPYNLTSETLLSRYGS